MSIKANVWEMNTIDAMHLALEYYDSEPDSKNPRKLYENLPLDLIAVEPSNLPKNTTDGKFVDVMLGELLGLTMMGAFYQQNKNIGYKVIVGLDDMSKSAVENILSDGAIRAFDESARMIFQQVSAQSYHLPKGKNIEDQIVDAVRSKESKRSRYPDKCALLVNVYSHEGGFRIQKVIDECDLTKFDIYFLAVYHLPGLQTCRVFYLNPQLNGDQVRDSGIEFKLSRTDEE